MTTICPACRHPDCEHGPHGCHHPNGRGTCTCTRTGGQQ